MPAKKNFLDFAQLFWNMTRRSLQLICLWFCLVSAFVQTAHSRQFDPFVFLFWLVLIYPPMAGFFGLLRQYFDDLDKATKTVCCPKCEHKFKIGI
jgi:hypothetical protein